VMAYMDDFIVISHSHWQALEHTTHTLHLLNQLGWQVNFEKSNLTPSQSKEFLGLLINTTGPLSFKVPPHKSHMLQHNIDHLLRLFRQQGQVPVQKLAAVMCQAAHPMNDAVPTQQTRAPLCFVVPGGHIPLNENSTHHFYRFLRCFHGPHSPSASPLKTM